MIGVTAAAGAGVLLAAGTSTPLAAPVAVGMVSGAYVGSQLLPGPRNRTVRWIFVLAVLAVEMILRGLGPP